MNERLKDYATSAGISFVSNDALLDEKTGDVLPGMLDGDHYTPAATALLALQLKRSLYGKEPLQDRITSDGSRPQPRQRSMQHQPRMLPHHAQRQSTGPSFPAQPRAISSIHPVHCAPPQTNQNAWALPQPMDGPLPQQPQGVNELLNAMGNFLQKWQTPPRPFF